MNYGSSGFNKEKKYLIGVQCKDCGKEFSNRKKMIEHIKQDHDYMPDWGNTGSDVLNDYCNKIYCVVEDGKYYKEIHRKKENYGIWSTEDKLRVKQL